MKKVLFASLVYLLLAAPVLAAGPDFTYQNLQGETVQGVRCATPEPTHQGVAPSGVYDPAVWAEKAAINIPVAFHVLTYYSRRDGGTVGLVSAQQIIDQIDILNAAYASANISFTLASTDYTDNKKWATMRPGSRDEQACKQALNVDPATTLNIYTCAPGGGLLGWSYFPDTWDESYFMHGSVIHWGSLPGSPYTWPYNLGDTATHEIGHYCGLYHTFQGGCTTPNDWCDDTPQEATATYGCPHGQDSCPAEGIDPIYNFMDYTDDDCMDHFTSDQAARMAEQLSWYRPTLVGAAKAAPDHSIVALTKTEILGVAPNPFNPKTEVSFYLEKSGHVRVNVYDLAGRLVDTIADESMTAGTKKVMFDGTGLPSAVYFVMLDTGDVQQTQRVLLLK